jgi:hypothetical protein
VVGGLTLRQQLASRSTVMGDLRYQTVTYNEADADTTAMRRRLRGPRRGADVQPAVAGRLRGGVENRAYDNEAYDDNTQPYGELSMTFLPTPATRLTARPPTRSTSRTWSAI